MSYFSKILSSVSVNDLDLSDGIYMIYKNDELTIIELKNRKVIRNFLKRRCKNKLELPPLLYIN